MAPHFSPDKSVLRGIAAAAVAIVVLACGFVFLPVTKVRPYCCIVDECEWVTGELSHQFKTSISRWPIPRYVSFDRTTRMSLWWRWRKYHPEILHKYSAVATVAIYKRTPTDRKPNWWPKGPMTGDDCCFMYRVALTERAWKALPPEKKTCRPNKGISSWWR